MRHIANAAKAVRYLCASDADMDRFQTEEKISVSSLRHFSTSVGKARIPNSMIQTMAARSQKSRVSSHILFGSSAALGGIMSKRYSMLLD